MRCTDLWSTVGKETILAVLKWNSYFFLRVSFFWHANSSQLQNYWGLFSLWKFCKLYRWTCQRRQEFYYLFYLLPFQWILNSVSCNFRFFNWPHIKHMCRSAKKKVICWKTPRPWSSFTLPLNCRGLSTQPAKSLKTNTGGGSFC